MRAATLNLTEDRALQQGASYELPLVWKTTAGEIIDITGYAARMHVRKSAGAPDILLECTTENGRLVIDGPAGQVSIVLAPEDTAGAAWRSGVYDLELVNGPAVTRLVEGEVELVAEVTR